MKYLLRRIIDRLSPQGNLFLLLVSCFVGATTGLAAVFFIRLIVVIQEFSYRTALEFLPGAGRLTYVLVPVAGALLVGPLIVYFAREAKGHGVPEVMQAIILHGGRIRPRVAVAKIVASALCIGTGGSAGREGPIVQVGSALGSTIGQWSGLSDERIKNLVSCGAAAGIAATFNAPIAGVAFATEVLMTELHGRLFGNVVVAAVAASIVSRLFLGSRPAFAVPHYTLQAPAELLLYLALGLSAALVGVMFIRMLTAFEDFFDHLAVPKALKPALGAFCLGGLGLAYVFLPGVRFSNVEQLRLAMPLMENMPHVFGAGFTFIEKVLQGGEPLYLLALLVFLKPLATSFTLGSGNSGGVFAPSLFTGAMFGAAFGHLAHALFPAIAGPVGGYALVGMAAVFAGAAHAPLTAMLIVFEMSNDYSLILPLMTAGIAATVTAEMVLPQSIYTIKLFRRGIRFRHGRDFDIMEGVLVSEVMRADPIAFDKDRPFTELYAAFQETHLQGFPVTHDGGRLYGIVTLQDVTRVLGQRREKISELTVADVATPHPLTVYPDEPVSEAIRKMSPRGLARLPVVSRQDDETLVGVVSRSEIMKAYEVGILRKQQVQYAGRHMRRRLTRDVEFVEFTVPADCPVLGRVLAEAGLPATANVVTVERNGTVLIPHGDTRIMVGDMVTILCRAGSGARVREIFGIGS